MISTFGLIKKIILRFILIFWLKMLNFKRELLIKFKIYRFKSWIFISGYKLSFLKIIYLYQHCLLIDKMLVIIKKS